MKSDDRVESVEDLGVYAGGLKDGTYPSVAIAAAQKIIAGEADRAILVCGTGIGVAIAANKVRGIRATVRTTRSASSDRSCPTTARC